MYFLWMVDGKNGLLWASEGSRQAVTRLRDVILRGELTELISIDVATGEMNNPEARLLLSALPAINPATAPDELISVGLINSSPKGLREALATPRYREGRELFVKTHISHDSPSSVEPAGQYDETQPLAFTHLARLRGRGRDTFSIQVEGASNPLDFALTDVFAWNEPAGFPPQGGTLNGVEVDYSDPLMKAHICAALIALDESIGALDFQKDATESAAAQAQVVHRLASQIRVDFAGRSDAYRGARAGALLSRGQGVSFVQTAVAVGFLQAFSRLLAFDVQAAAGRTLQENVPHGFAVVTLRPSMKRFVCDPTWGEPLTDLRVAFFGPRWGHNRRVVSFEGHQELRVRPDEVEVSETDTREPVML